MDISQLTSLLSAALPYSGAITALADLGIDITKIITPDLAQKYDNNYRSDLSIFASIMAEPDSIERADQLADFVGGVCLDDGTPIVGIPAGPSELVPVAALVALVNDALLYRRERAINDELILGAKQQQPAVAAPATK
jgi:hypothetical protein